MWALVYINYQNTPVVQDGGLIVDYNDMVDETT